MKHVLFINPNKDTFSNPTLVAVLDKMILTKKLKVTILAPKQIIDTPSHLTEINFMELPDFSVNWSKKVKSWLPKIIFLIKLIRFCQKNKIKHIVGIDPIGLIYAGRIKRFLKKSILYYFSFEIFFRNEVKNLDYFRKIKEKEINYSKFIDFLVIQDEVRKQLLVQENNLDTTKFKTFLIPVSPNVGIIEGEYKSNWRKKISIPDDKIVLLHSGSLEKWSGGDLIINLLESGLAENQLVVIHSKSELNLENPIHSKLVELEKQGFPVLIHKTIFSDYEEYLSFLHIADFALVLYEKDESSPYTGKNIEEIGLASGKFSCFMSQGIPVITRNSRIYKELNKKYNFGCVIENLSEIKLINLNEDFKFNSLNLYNDELNSMSLVEEYCYSFYSNTNQLLK